VAADDTTVGSTPGRPADFGGRRLPREGSEGTDLVGRLLRGMGLPREVERPVDEPAGRLLPREVHEPIGPARVGPRAGAAGQPLPREVGSAWGARPGAVVLPPCPSPGSGSVPSGRPLPREVRDVGGRLPGEGGEWTGGPLPREVPRLRRRSLPGEGPGVGMRRPGEGGEGNGPGAVVLPPHPSPGSASADSRGGGHFPGKSERELPREVGEPAGLAVCWRSRINPSPGSRGRDLCPRPSPGRGWGRG